MAATIHQLFPQPAAIGGFLRVGHTGQRKLEELHAAGRLHFNRFVFDAAYVGGQIDLLKALKASGCEIVLDPNFAEMSLHGKFGQAVSRLPWANSGALWKASDFGPGSNSNPARLIAEFAIRYGAQVVLAPSHLAEAVDDSWWAVDRRLCEALRFELDRHGGSGIAIDHQIITTNAVLKDPVGRAQMASAVSDLPVQNVWLKIAGFGANATGAGARAYIESVRQLHGIGRPFVADAVGGFAGLAAAAFGAVSGISHGVCQREKFVASEWKRPRSGGGGGAETRIYIQDLDRYLDEAQFDIAIAANGGKSRFGCTDADCCRSIEEQVNYFEAHMLTQRSRQLEELSRINEFRRAEHLLLHHIDPAIRSARRCAKLKFSDDKVATVVVSARDRLIRLREALGDLHGKDMMPTQSRALFFRGGAGSISAVIGR
jgi:hypothetical protein